MKKIFVCLFIILANISTLAAQNFHIEKSDQFDEPEDGWSKLLQLKNGNTLFFHANDKEGIEVTVYDKNRKKTANHTITSDNWDAGKLSESTMCGLYEINGEAVLFLYQRKREPILFRIRVNSENGSVIKEDDLGHLNNLPPSTMGVGFALYSGLNGIAVEKDPGSDYYAVIFYDYDKKEHNTPIRICQFDGTHQKINEVNYIPSADLKTVMYNSALADGKSVYVILCSYIGGFGNQEVKLILSKVSVGETTVKNNRINADIDLEDVASIMLYNHNNDKIQLFTKSLTSSENKMLGAKVVKYYASFITYIDPESLSVTSRKQITESKVNQYVHDHIDKDYDYTAIPQQMILNQDKTTTVLMEDMTSDPKHTFLGCAGIAELSDEGMELRGYAINKKQESDDSYSKLSYMSRRSKKMTRSSTPYVSYDYVNTAKGRYVIFNDLADNYEKGEDEKKRKTMYSGSGANAICFKLNDNSIEKSYLFGDPDKDGAGFCYIESSDFNKISGTYAAIVVDGEGKHKQACIAWVNF